MAKKIFSVAIAVAMLVVFTLTPVFAESELNAIMSERLVRPDMAGRMSFTGVGKSVALYAPTFLPAQTIVDSEDSACYMQWSEQTVIVADHSTQEFSVLETIKAGDFMVIDDGMSLKVYVCTSVIAGHNTGITITDASYNDVTDFEGVICYTCHGDSWWDITIAFFKLAV